MLQHLDQAHSSGKLYMPTSLLYFVYPQKLKVVKTLTGDIWGWNPTDLSCHVGWGSSFAINGCILVRLSVLCSYTTIHLRTWYPPAETVFCCCSKGAQSWKPQWVRTERHDENMQGGREALIWLHSILTREGESSGWMPTNAQIDEWWRFITEPKWLQTGHYQISLVTKLHVEGDK